MQFANKKRRTRVTRSALSGCQLQEKLLPAVTIRSKHLPLMSPSLPHPSSRLCERRRRRIKFAAAEQLLEFHYSMLGVRISN
jgi:hypothetical protein